MSLIDLSGQVAIVTGGSRGVGAATVHLLAQAGASVAIVFQRREGAARDVARQVEQAGGRATIIQGDVARADDCQRIVDETIRAFDRLDIYVANAGIWPEEDVGVATMPDDRWQQTMRVNLDSVFFGTRSAIPRMHDDGRLVIVSSTAGQRGEAFHADYAATKGALIAFVKSLAVEVAPRLTVNAVAPGWIDTEMSKGPYERNGGRGREAIAAGIPLRRIATAEDVAGPILFLCSPLARHVTGEILNVNGGAVLCG
jgi:3-oxoacyl-[acyl-carrier protein] reductase